MWNSPHLLSFESSHDCRISPDESQFQTSPSCCYSAHFFMMPGPKVARFLHLSFLLCISFVITKSKGIDVETANYGVDVSFPIHRYIKDKSSLFYKRYQKSMEGCYKAYSRGSCDATELARMEMNLEQPRSQHNYTEIGFKKTRVPDALFEEILQFYEANKNSESAEEWPRGNTYVNNWESPTYMISFEDQVSGIRISFEIFFF